MAGRQDEIDYSTLHRSSAVASSTMTTPPMSRLAGGGVGSPAKGDAAEQLKGGVRVGGTRAHHIQGPLAKCGSPVS